MDSEVNTHGIEDFASLLLMENWRARLKSHLRDKGITQSELATRLGMTQGGIGHWLTGRNEITLTDFGRLCKAAEANPQMVLFGLAPSGAELINEIRRIVRIAPTDDSVAGLQTQKKPRKTREKRHQTGKKPAHRHQRPPRLQ